MRFSAIVSVILQSLFGAELGDPDSYAVALLDEATRPTDPAKIRIDLDGVPGYVSQFAVAWGFWALFLTDRL